jgi:hypothetical protein
MFNLSNLSKAIILIGMSTVAQADIQTSASVLGSTNNTLRGNTITDNDLGLGFSASVKDSVRGLFGTYDLNTVSLKERKANMLHIVSGGIQKNVLSVPVSAGYRIYSYSGSNDLGKASDLNFGEAFISTTIYGVSAEYSKTLDSSVLNNSKDSYARIGYGSAYSGYNISGGISKDWYNKRNTSGTSYDISVAKDLTKNITVVAKYDITGNDSLGVNRKNQFSITSSYKF